MNSKTRQRWGYRTNRQLNVRSLVVFLIVGPCFALWAGLFWMLCTGDGPLEGITWSVQTMTTVGYGVGWSSWNDRQLVLSIFWMLLSATYWGCLISVLGSLLTDAFKR